MLESQNLLKMEQFVKRAQELMESHPDAEQIVVVWTKKGNLLHFVNHDVISGGVEEENAFLKTLAENGDTKIRCAVCMWKDFTIDMMSRHLLESLICLDSDNKETIVIIKGAEGFRARTIKTCLPR